MSMEIRFAKDKFARILSAKETFVSHTFAVVFFCYFLENEDKFSYILFVFISYLVLFHYNNEVFPCEGSFLYFVAASASFLDSSPNSLNIQLKFLIN